MAKLKKSINQERVEQVIGQPIKRGSWDEYNNRFQFRPQHNDITLAQVIALSIEFDTDEINFNVGYSPEPDLSDVTPGSPGSTGYIEIRNPRS
jgi:hypothetical protein